MPSNDQCVNPTRYTLIPRTLVFLTRGLRVLLLKGAPNKRLWANLYNGVGGHLERGEDVLSSAARELYEETGLRSPDLWLCGVITVDTRQEVGIGIYVCKGECLEGETRPSSEGKLAWIDFSEAVKLPLVEDLYQLLPRVLRIQRGEPPFAALYSYDELGRIQIRW